MALLRLSVELSAKTNTHAHAINTFSPTHADRVCFGTPAGQHGETRVHSAGKGQEVERKSGGTEWNETRLNTFPTFHLLLIVGGVALCGPLVSAKRRSGYTFRVRRGEDVGGGLHRLWDLTLTPSGGLCTTVL